MFQETCFIRGGRCIGVVPQEAIPLGVWRQKAEAKEWKVIESLCAFAGAGGITVRTTYEALREEIMDDLRRAMPVDAVFLSLHGAMVAEGYEDAEGDLLERVRHVVGPAVPIGVELDLHANVSDRMLECATAIILFKEYPHIDLADRAAELFQIINDTMEGRVHPTMGWFDCRTIGVFHTTREPMRGLVDRCTALEGRDGVLSISIAHGFPWADVTHMGSKVLVVTDGDRLKACQLAQELGRALFHIRSNAQPIYVSVEAAIEKIAKGGRSKPLIIADVSDNAGGGAPSDSTWILRSLLEHGVQSCAIGMFWDPMVVRIAFEVGIGVYVSIRLGGKLGPLSGAPLDLRARVTGLRRNAFISPSANDSTGYAAGDMTAIEVGEIAIVCNSLRTQCLSLDCFEYVGIEPAQKSVVVVKSMQHFHTAFAPIASDILYVATPGVVSPSLRTLPYTKASTLQWPLVADPFTGEPEARNWSFLSPT